MPPYPRHGTQAGGRGSVRFDSRRMQYWIPVESHFGGGLKYIVRPRDTVSRPAANGRPDGGGERDGRKKSERRIHHTISDCPSWTGFFGRRTFLLYSRTSFTSNPSHYTPIKPNCQAEIHFIYPQRSAASPSLLDPAGMPASSRPSLLLLLLLLAGMMMAASALSAGTGQTTTTAAGQRTMTRVVWFRDHCLRLSDNPSLSAAVEACLRSSSDDPDGGGRVLPVFLWQMGTDVAREGHGGTARDVLVARALGHLDRALGGEGR